MDFFNNKLEEDLEQDLEQEIMYDDMQAEKKPTTKFGLGMFIGILISLAIALISIVIIVFFRQNIYSGIDFSNNEKISTILAYLDRFFLYDFDENAIEDGLSKGLLSGLGDKYANYYTKEEFDQLVEETTGEYAGIGVSVTQLEDGTFQVYKVFSDSPANAAGLHAKDLIIAVDGETQIKDLDALVSLVKGEPGTKVELGILRGGETLNITVERQIVHEETVAFKMLNNNIGYIAISQFETNTSKQFDKAISELTKQGMNSVIFDLRDNPGGDYDTVVAMADRVLPKGKILTTKDKNNNEKTETSDEEHQLHIPMVLLVNGNSASAAELFTGAIQDYGWATIVGTQTFGKGIVQSIFKLPDGSGIKFTTDKYFTPKGRDINGVGITPDVVIDIPEDAYKDGLVTEDEDTQLQKAIEILSESAN